MKAHLWMEVDRCTEVCLCQTAVCVYKIAGSLCLGMDFSALCVRYVILLGIWYVWKVIWKSVKQRFVTKRAMWRINVEQHFMSFLSWSRTLRRCWFVKTGVWILIIVVIKIRIQYFGVLGFYAAWIGGYRRLGTTCLIFRGPICCSETSTTTNRRCVTSQKSEDLIYIVAEAWNRGPVFVFAKSNILSWCSSELPDGCWNSAFKWR